MHAPLQRTITLLLMSLLATVAFGAEPTLPQSLTRAVMDVRPVGAGTLRWFGFDIYDATLWTPNGAFDGAFDAPVAFTLAYRRSFSRERLIGITRSAWEELALASPEQRERWGHALQTIWVDVHKGSELTTVVMPRAETRFYDNDRLLGRIDDAAFGPAFLRIWLDARVADTALGDLRTQLLAMPSGTPASKHDPRP